MRTYEAITSAQILIGIVLLALSVRMALRTRLKTPADLRARWSLLIAFLGFFILGYSLYLFVVLSSLRINMELIAGNIFMAGAFFVVLVMMIAKVTVNRIVESEAELRLTNETLLAGREQLRKEFDERVRAQKSLVESEEKYRSLVESTDDSIYVVDREANYVFINRKHQERLGLSDDSYMGRSYAEFHSPQQAGWFRGTIEEIFRTGSPAHYEYQSERDERHFLQTMSPVRAQDGEITAVSVISKNITHLKNLEEELRVLSLTDELTGLYNRRGFFTLAEQQLRMATRLDKGVHLLYIDLDYLKLINDTLGHKEGDSALVKLGELLKVTYRESDIIARIGGDEFAVFPVASPDGDLDSVSRRLLDNIEQSNAKGNSKFDISVSTGMAYYDPDKPVSLEELLLEADRQMYKQKKTKPQL